MIALGYIPLLQPCGWFGTHWWVLMVPLVFGIAVAYRATHDATIAGFWRGVTRFTTKSMVAMVILAVMMYLFVYLVLPRLPAG